MNDNKFRKVSLIELGQLRLSPSPASHVTFVSAQVVSERMVNLRVGRVDDEGKKRTEEMTYSGDFTIIWAAEGEHLG